MPTPSRRTFATDILSFAHSMLTTLRHPACACQQRRLSGCGQPSRSKPNVAGISALCGSDAPCGDRLAATRRGGRGCFASRHKGCHDVTPTCRTRPARISSRSSGPTSIRSAWSTSGLATSRLFGRWRPVVPRPRRRSSAGVRPLSCRAGAALGRSARCPHQPPHRAARGSG